MIIKIHQSCSTKNALFYNERKVERHKAIFYHSQYMPVLNPFMGDKNYRYKVFRKLSGAIREFKSPGCIYRLTQRSMIWSGWAIPVSGLRSVT